jgi:hypothetical protein
MGRLDTHIKADHYGVLPRVVPILTGEAHVNEDGGHKRRKQTRLSAGALDLIISGCQYRKKVTTQSHSRM